jgi:hypothetical protein
MSAVARRCSAVFLRPRAVSRTAATIQAVASAIPACRVKVASCSCRDLGDRDGVVHVGGEEVSRTQPVVRLISRGGHHDTVTQVGVPPAFPMALCHHYGNVALARTEAANCSSLTCRSYGAMIQVTSASLAAFVSVTNLSLTSCWWTRARCSPS